ncbi:MAG: PIG-L family deacetylase [Anaerolineae bacterium]|nr:PIG-L family deacetylase [Anaerolineae bacterium]
MPDKLTLAAIFAHPDDEAFGVGGTLSKYAHEGVDVHLITATLGEAGEVANPDFTFTQPLSVVREFELRCACKHYGVKELHLLGYIDGQTTVVPQGAAVYKIVKLLRQLKPQVVISFGPDGVYGHYDHLAVHRWATAAVQLAGQADCWPEAGSRHAVAKFYHRALPADQVAQMEKIMGRNYVPMDGVPFPFVGYPMAQITTVIDARDYAGTKLKGIRCHASQLAPENPYQQDFDVTANPLFWQETFILAHCRPDIRSNLPPERKEDDLFAGLR